MNETSGIIVYQEQYLLDCKTFANWDIAFSDKNVRKNKDILNDIKLKEKFITDTINNGYKEDIANYIWEEIVNTVSGGYGFNKAHSASYGELSYQTIYLQTNYQLEFFASLLTNNSTKFDNLVKYIAFAKQRGIEILPPDINKISDKFEIEDNSIRFMFSALKGIGKATTEAIQKCMPVTSLEYLIENTTKSAVNKSNLETLIKAGVFDFEETNRIKLLNKMYKLRNIKGQELPEDMWNKDLEMMFEYQIFGVYLKTHPVEKYKYRNFKDFSEGQTGKIAGKVEKVSTILDKNGNKMAFVDISNQYGMDNLLIFSSVWNNKDINTKNKVEEGNLIEVSGQKSKDKFIVRYIEQLF